MDIALGDTIFDLAGRHLTPAVLLAAFGLWLFVASGVAGRLILGMQDLGRPLRTSARQSSSSQTSA